MAQHLRQAVAKDEVKQIECERIGFRTLAGDHKLRLLPKPWPQDSQPAASASLLAIASRKGLIAAAGPDTLVVGSSTDARNALISNSHRDDAKVTDFTPQSTLSIPRVSHIAFSSDEGCLVIAAEQGGGLAVYGTNKLPMQQPSFQIATNGVGVLQLLPNPNPAADFACYFGIVLETGQLLIADLKAQKLATNTTNGSPVFLENISCACWSRLGKQIVAGRKDGTAAQVDPHGNIKAEIPLPPQLPALANPKALGYPLTSIYWLDTLDFLFIHSTENPKIGSGDSMEDALNETSYLHLVHGNKADSCWEFKTVPDPTPGYLENGRVPARHFIQRLRDWPPDLEDTLMMISTISSDVGIMTKSKVSLDKTPENAAAGVFTTTLLADGRGAPLPMSVADEISDTSAIGMATDLSATLANTETIPRPIPSDEEFEEAKVPLPALCVLNNEGMLSVWWIIYDESMYKNVTYPGMVCADASDGSATPSTVPANTAKPSPFGSHPAPQALAFGSISKPAQASTFGSPSPLGRSSQQPATQTLAFGSTSSLGQISQQQRTPFGTVSMVGQPAFGSTAFGGSSAIGKSASPWGTPSNTPAGPAVTAAKPVFGSSTSIGGGAGFGQVGGMGAAKTLPWGSASNASQPSASHPNTTTATTFGGNASAQSPFTAFGKKIDDMQQSALSGMGASTPNASPFSQLPGAENKRPFTADLLKPALPKETSGSTVSMGSGFSFGSGSTIAPFGTPSQNSSFGKPSQSREETMGDDSSAKPAEEQKQESGGLFGFPQGGFKIGSTFKSDGSAKDDLPKPTGSGQSLFGNGFLSELPKKLEPVTPIKSEPGTQEVLKLQDIPEASSALADTLDDPLKYKPKRFAGDLPPMDVPSDPPIQTDDPLEYKPKRFAGDLPPMDVPGDSPRPAASQKSNEEEQRKGEGSDAPVAGSPPVDLGNEKFSETAGSDVALPEDDNEEWSEEDGEDGENENDEEEDEDEEGSEDDEDDEDGSVSGEITDPKGLAAFEARLTPASPKHPEQKEESTTPATDKRISFTPAGFPQPPISFPPPRKVQESPRSPSPQRSTMASRAVTSPMPPSPKFGKSPAVPSYSASKPLPTQTQKIVVPPARPLERRAPSQHVEPEIAELEDDEDARLKEIIGTAADPTREIPEFIAHQNFAESSGKHGLAGTIEKVFIDINSMVTTLGWNARSLQSFVDGHLKLRKDTGRERNDLEDPEDWALDEVNDLSLVQNFLEETLEDRKLEDPREKVASLREQEKEVSRVRSKIGDIRKQVAIYADPEQRAMQTAAPLSTETETQQSELRQSVQKVQKVLTQTEEAMSLLRADLSSAAAATTSTSGSSKKHVPSVEAVTNTIQRMTAMIEQKSGDIDVLESQIRRLPNGIVSLSLNADYEDDLIGALRGGRLLNSSPRTTPAPQRSRTAANGDPLGMSGMFGASSSRLRTPLTASRRSGMFSPEASALGRSAGSSARKKMRDVTEAETEAFELRAGARGKVLAALKKGLERRGTRAVRME